MLGNFSGALPRRRSGEGSREQEVRRKKCGIYCVGNAGARVGDGDSVGDGIGWGAVLDREVGGSTRSPVGTTVVIKRNFSYPTTNDSKV
jgi:hypothetical protein